MPDGFQFVWMKLQDQPQVRLGYHDPNLGTWHPVDSTELLTVTHWCPLEPAPSLLSHPDEAILIANRLAGIMERIIWQIPEPWDAADLAVVDECVKAARRLRGRK